jgi:hypothetical protein
MKIVGDENLEARDAADRAVRIGSTHPFSPPKQQLAGDAAVADFLLLDDHDELVAAGVLPGGEVLADVFEPFLQLRNVVGEMTNAAAQLENGFLVFAAQAAEASDLRVDAGPLDDERVAGSDCLHFRVGERRAVNVFDAALDLRLMRPSARDAPNGKANQAVENILRIWRQTGDRRSAQLVFCDLSTPKDRGFSVYRDMADKLQARGIPQREIAFIQDYDSDASKLALFRDVRAGKARVLFGSTQKMGSGTNVQERLIALHHLDAPWRETLEQLRRDEKWLARASDAICAYWRQSNARKGIHGHAADAENSTTPESSRSIARTLISLALSLAPAIIPCARHCETISYAWCRWWDSNPHGF